MSEHSYQEFLFDFDFQLFCTLQKVLFFAFFFPLPSLGTV